MTKIVKSKYKSSRRVETSIWGEDKDAFHKRNYRPGMHGKTVMRRVSDYGLHLREKQTLKMHYGRVTERQFKNTFILASKAKGNTVDNFVNLLERRLDMVVYRMNFAPTIFAARQLVSHRGIKVNGKKVNIASQRLNDGDQIEFVESMKQVPVYLESIQKQNKIVPDYMSVDTNNMSGTFLRAPMVSDVPYPFEVNFNKIVEYYSR